ncbi:hypothetical protein OXYTRIMIC_445 [Oxytricha trifallax]|uniref:Parvovirus non-structural protein 1 helicase domain-containing protein n=1 Tax=Oxytricha trifallax TaxID=1172189 RepID=A0A073HWS0_9SPIT|nr:hypothetical protein OXYTRIMIC_445 [Oxytricha trifallax]
MSIEDLIIIGSIETKLKQHARLIKDAGLLQLECVPLIRSLQEYLLRQSMESVNEPTLTSQYFINEGHGEVIEALYQILLKRKDQKMNSVWIVGPTNAGKTTIDEMLRQIFICDILEDGVSHFFVKAANIDMSQQITLMDEMNHQHYFGNKKNLAIMKKMMEGKGYAIDVNEIWRHTDGVQKHMLGNLYKRRTIWSDGEA